MPVCRQTREVCSRETESAQPRARSQLVGEGPRVLALLEEHLRRAASPEEHLLGHAGPIGRHGRGQHVEAGRCKSWHPALLVANGSALYSIWFVSYFKNSWNLQALTSLRVAFRRPRPRFRARDLPSYLHEGKVR